MTTIVRILCCAIPSVVAAGAFGFAAFVGVPESPLDIWIQAIMVAIGLAFVVMAIFAWTKFPGW